MCIITKYSSVHHSIEPLNVCMLCYPKLGVKSGRDTQNGRQATHN